MFKRIRSVIIRMVVLWILFFLVAGAFCYILFALPGGAKLEEYFNSSLVKTETLYIVLALGVILIACLLLMSISAARTVSRLKKIQKAWNRFEKKLEKKKKGDKTIRFGMLHDIDKEYAGYDRKKHDKDKLYDDCFSLEELCEKFRNYAASRLHLYYTIEDIRRFIAGLGVSKLLILQGMSGTGKTSLAYAMGQFLQNDSVVVPVQPMWKERSDMIGYFNEFTKRFNETVLLRKMYEAGYREDLFITILDEVNISRIEYYFAEFLSLLALPDDDKRYLDVVADVWPNDPVKLVEGKIKLPSNMWFIGTANNDDSTFAISDKVYDRAMVISLEKKCAPFEAEDTAPIFLSSEYFSQLVISAKENYALSKESESNINKLDKYMLQTFEVSFGNRVMRQIREYVPIMIACGGTEAQAIDDILVRKVLRKLETLNPSFVHSYLDDLRQYMNDLFGNGSMVQCMEYIGMLENMT